MEYPFQTFVLHKQILRRLMRRNISRGAKKIFNLLIFLLNRTDFNAQSRKVFQQFERRVGTDYASLLSSCP